MTAPLLPAPVLGHPVRTDAGGKLGAGGVLGGRDSDGPIARASRAPGVKGLTGRSSAAADINNGLDGAIGAAAVFASPQLVGRPGAVEWSRVAAEAIKYMED